MRRSFQRRWQHRSRRWLQRFGALRGRVRRLRRFGRSKTEKPSWRPAPRTVRQRPVPSSISRLPKSRSLQALGASMSFARHQTFVHVLVVANRAVLRHQSRLRSGERWPRSSARLGRRESSRQATDFDQNWARQLGHMRPIAHRRDGRAPRRSAGQGRAAASRPSWRSSRTEINDTPDTRHHAAPSRCLCRTGFDSRRSSVTHQSQACVSSSVGMPTDRRSRTGPRPP